MYTKDYIEPGATPKKTQRSWLWILIVVVALIGLFFLAFIYKDNLPYWFNYETVLLPASLIIVGSIATIIWLVPKRYVKSLQNKPLNENQSEFDREKEKLKLEDDTRKTLAQIIGGAVFLFGLIFTYNTYRLNLEQMKISLKQQDINQEGQITDRFTKAISQLGDEDVTVRLGGLYALERIAKDSPKDHWTIMEIISSYVREKSPTYNMATVIVKPEKRRNYSPLEKKLQEEEDEVVRTDIQAALTIIGRRIITQDPSGAKIDFNESNLIRANLNNANLAGAILDFADLNQASLVNANLIGAHLNGAILNGANLSGANLSEAVLRGNLLGANLNGANLTGATLSATFGYADLKGANFGETDLREAVFDGADLSGAKLRFAKSLTLEQLENAIIDEETQLPSDLEIHRQELLSKSKQNLYRREHLLIKP